MMNIIVLELVRNIERGRNMSILQFMDMSVFECLFGSIFAIAVCLCFSGLGYLFVPKRGIIIQSVLGMTVIGTIGVFCAELCAGIYKYCIFVTFLIGFFITIYRLFKKKIYIKEIGVALFPILTIFAIVFIQIMRYVVPSNGIF